MLSLQVVPFVGYVKAASLPLVCFCLSILNHRVDERLHALGVGAIVLL